MKILLVITGLGMGGAERQVVDLAEKFVGLGHRVRIIYLTGEALVKPASSDIQLVALNIAKTPLGLIKAVFSLRRTVKEFAPDVVHSHMVHANLVARITRLFQPMRRLICTAHSTNEGGKLRVLAYRYTDFLADVSTNVSEAAVRGFLSAGASRPGRMTAVYNGIDLTRFRPSVSNGRWVSSSRKLLAVGRFYPEKDYSSLVQALEIVRKNKNAAEFVVDIAGDGPERPRIEAMVEALGLSDRVRFLGIRTDIPSLMQDADIFVLSSAWEGFGLVVAEAMACGKVVVATDCGGVKEVLNGKGFLVPPKSPTDLADALSEAMALDETKAKTIGQEARRHVEQTFGLDAVAGKWISIYSQRENSAKSSDTEMQNAP